MKKYGHVLADSPGIKHTGEQLAFPFRVCYETFSGREKDSFPFHWHPEVQFTYVAEGTMEYQTNNDFCRVSAGNGIFINSQVLHMAGNLSANSDCRYILFLLDPVIIYGFAASPVYQKYVEPIYANPEFFAKYLDSNSPFGSKMLSLLLETASLYQAGESGSELLITEKLCALWYLLYQETAPLLNKKETGSAAEIDRLKMAISFIQSHYSEDITLNDIAGSCHISKSECCHLFKRTLRQTPFSYLLDYRIKQSLPLLSGSNRSMTEIAIGLGFHGSSYFAETFRKIMDCSPSAYRKMHISHENG